MGKRSKEVGVASPSEFKESKLPLADPKAVDPVLAALFESAVSQ
jgi:hypothetical protein